MISEWRRVWSINTGTNPNFPFGFVQLSTWQANDLSPDFPMIRWYQTNKYGYTPNDVLQASYLCCVLQQNSFYYRSIIDSIIYYRSVSEKEDQVAQGTGSEFLMNYSSLPRVRRGEEREM